MPSDEWERGFAAGWRAARDPQSSTLEEVKKERLKTPGKKRKTSPYQTAYGNAFKKIAPKHKTKKGAWKKGGFKRTQKAAHAEAKRRTK